MIRRGVGEHVGRVRHGEAARLGRVDVDVVEADAEVGQQLRPQRLGRQHLGGELVGDGGEQGVRGPERFLQAVRP